MPMGEEIEFDAVGIETVDRRPRLRPAPGPEGVLQTYQVHDLHGVAQRVSFRRADHTASTAGAGSTPR